MLLLYFPLFWTAYKVAEMGLSHKKSWRYLDLERLDQVRWQQISSSKKGSSSKHKGAAGGKVFPCYIVEDHEMALSGIDSIKISKRNNTLIRFVGYNAANKDDLQAVPESQLRPFGDFAAANNNDDNNNEPQWNAQLLQQYLDLIQHQQKFLSSSSSSESSNNTGAVNFRAEKIYLQLFLQFVWRKEQQAELSQQQQLQQQTLDDDDSSMNDRDDDDDDERLVLSHGSNPVTQDSGDDEHVVAAPERPNKAPRPGGVVQPDTLRAGDLIVYWCVSRNPVLL